ncbi:MAG: response regulator transcription factor [Rhodoferax sp.]|nr:response regulator transcription factor [Rhodoferax sp.]
MVSPRILLIDDHAMFRAGLCMVIGGALPGACIFEAATLESALCNAPDALDVVLLDIQLKGTSGLEGLKQIKHKWPQMPVLMLSSQDEPHTQRLALARGAAGFVSKAEAADNIIAAIELVLRGELAAATLPDDSPPTRQLTPRQREVLDLLHQGLSNKLIARQLALSDNTVRRHVQDILEFLGVLSRSEAVFVARKQGLLS